MKALALLMSLASTFPTGTYTYAKFDYSPQSVLIKTFSFPQEDLGNDVSRGRYLSLRLEPFESERTPVEVIGDIFYVQYPMTITWSKSTIRNRSYSVSLSLATKLEAKARFKFGINYLAEAYGEFLVGVSTSLQGTLSYSIEDVMEESIEMQIDGVANNFGYYLLTYDALAPLKYYFYYSESIITNWSQIGSYQNRIFFYENDTHFYVSNLNDYALNVRYFETGAELNAFLATYDL